MDNTLHRDDVVIFVSWNQNPTVGDAGFFHEFDFLGTIFGIDQRARRVNISSLSTIDNLLTELS